MDIAAVIKQLKDHCPVLGTRVGGAAEFDLTAKNVFLSLPCAYVIPLASDAEPNEDQNGLWQDVSESISVILVLDNSKDRRGQASALSVYDLEKAVHKALLWGFNPQPERAAKGFQYEGSGLQNVDGGHLMWQMTYSQKVVLTDADGFQPDNVPFTHIDGHRADNKTILDVTLDQDV